MKTLILLFILTSLSYCQSDFMLLMGDEGVSLPTLQLNGKETSITVTLSGIKDSAKVYRDSVYVHTFTSNGSWVDTPLVVGNYGYYAMNYLRVIQVSIVMRYSPMLTLKFQQ